MHHDNDDVLDELVALYRQSANETAPRRVDAKVLRAAEARRLHRAWPWLGLAMAASFALWLMVFHAMPMPPAPPVQAHHDATATYLLHMDIRPPQQHADGLSHTAAYLYADINSNSLENAP
ncbi:hypothetical protein FHW84_003048 [Dyella sp. SG562]|uniref:hypothetical protein n=1 Tax=Dyella sp. SG562 TaxID=2587017 RepID=UPI00141E9F6F|nr:hypothetical protein [Dyella sp. SG562]NII74458.1 hypothetical protein [Dyella sp. SG562]